MTRSLGSGHSLTMRCTLNVDTCLLTANLGSKERRRGWRERASLTILFLTPSVLDRKTTVVVTVGDKGPLDRTVTAPEP